MSHDDTLAQRIVITIDLDHEPGNDTIAAAVFLHVLDRLEHDSIRPLRSALEITSPTTTP